MFLTVWSTRFEAGEKIKESYENWSRERKFCDGNAINILPCDSTFASHVRTREATGKNFSCLRSLHCLKEELNNLRRGSLWLFFDPPYARHSILIGFLWKFVGEKFFLVNITFWLFSSMFDVHGVRKQSLPEGRGEKRFCGYCKGFLYFIMLFVWWTMFHWQMTSPVFSPSTNFISLHPRRNLFV